LPFYPPPPQFHLNKVYGSISQVGKALLSEWEKKFFKEIPCNSEEGIFVVFLLLHLDDLIGMLGGGSSGMERRLV
jgi:hypothetical protein